MTAVAFAPNGHMLAGTSGSSLYLWNLPSGRLKVLTGCQPRISSVTFSPNGQLVAVGSGTGGIYRGSGAICLWQIQTSKMQASLKGNVAYVGSVTFSPDGKSLAASCGVDKGVQSKPNPTNLVRLWNVKTKTIQWEVKGGYAEGDVAFSVDGQLLAVGDTIPKLLNARTGKPVAPLAPLPSSAWHIAFSTDGKVLAGGGMHGPLVFWDTTNGKWIDWGNGLDHYSVRSLVFSPDGKRLASGDSQGIVKIWDVSQLNQRKQLPNPQLISHLNLLMTLDTIKGQVIAAKKA